jgi:hypothetical protein
MDVTVVTGLTFLAIGSLGTGGAVVMEVWKKEPVYMIMMKVFPWFFGVGGVVIGFGLAG